MIGSELGTCEVKTAGRAAVPQPWFKWTVELRISMARLKFEWDFKRSKKIES